MYCSGHFVVRCIEMINNKKLKSLDSFVGDGRDVEIILHDGRRNLGFILYLYREGEGRFAEINFMG